MMARKSSMDASEDDWRSQMDSMYSGSEYNDLISLSSKVIRVPDTLLNDYAFDESMGSTGKKGIDAIRFPPVMPVDLPDEQYKREFEQNFDLRGSFHKEAPEDEEAIASLDFLENVLLTTVEKVIDIRASVIENGTYVNALSNPPTAEEVDYMKTVIMENLNTLREESMALMMEMDTFQPENVEDMLYGETPTTNTVIRKLQVSLQDRANRLKNAIAESALVVDGLTQYSNSIVWVPTDKVCKLDGIHIDWTVPHKLQDRQRASNRSLNFADFMRSHGFPVCNDIFCYLQSTKNHGNVLSITGYRFQPGELKTALEFFDLQHEKSSQRLAGSDFLSSYRSVKFLVIDDCELSDRDCHTLASKLSSFANLVSLSLPKNRITFSGVASLSAAFFESGSNLRALRLDHNLIRSDGALFIAQVLHKLPFLEVLSLAGNPLRDKGAYFLFKYLLNPHRACAGKLHKPSSRWTAAAHGTNMDDSDSEDAEEAASNTDTAVTDAGRDLTPHQRFVRRKIQRKCYFDDYFKSHFSRPQPPELATEDHEDDMAFAIAQREKVQWINTEEDEFMMDTKSEYSDTGDDVVPGLGSLRISGPVPEASRGASESGVSMTQPSAAELEGLAAKRYGAYGHCPRLIQLLMKLRVRLVAVNAFARLLRTGPVLTSLSIAGCKLTSDIVPTIAQALKDNHNVLSLDVSNNPEMLVAPTSCKLLAQTLEGGVLQTVLLNNCGVNDRGFMELTSAASNSHTVRTLELSDNPVGPTGANWAATANKMFFLDGLTISGDFHASAPFKRRGDPSMTSVFDDETQMADSVRGASDEGKAQLAEDYESDGIASYEDTDLFDGDEYDDFERDAEDSLELSAEEAESVGEGEEDDGEEYDAYGDGPEDAAERGHGGGTVVSQASRASRSSRASFVATALKGVSGLMRHGLSKARSKGEGGGGASDGEARSPSPHK